MNRNKFAAKQRGVPLFAKWDFLPLLLVLVFLFVSLFFTFSNQRGQMVTATVDGKTVWQCSLLKDTIYTLQTPYGQNTITVKKRRCSVTAADCPDGLCQKSGSIFKAGQSIVCLPHRLIVEVS